MIENEKIIIRIALILFSIGALSWLVYLEVFISLAFIIMALGFWWILKLEEDEHKEL